MHGSVMAGDFDGSGLRSESDLLPRNATFKGKLSLNGAKVRGNLEMDGATVNGELEAGSLHVGGDLNMRKTETQKSPVKISEVVA